LYRCQKILDNSSRVECKICTCLFPAENFCEHLEKCKQTSFATTLQKPFVNSSQSSPRKLQVLNVQKKINETFIEGNSETETVLKLQLKEILTKLSETEKSNELRQLKPISINQPIKVTATPTTQKKTKAVERYSESTNEILPNIGKTQCKTSRVEYHISQIEESSGEIFSAEKSCSRQVTSQQPWRKDLADDMNDVIEGIFEVDQELREAEPGGTEGSISIPRETMRSLPYFAKNKRFASIASNESASIYP